MAETRRPDDGPAIQQPPPISDPARPNPPAVSRFIILVAVVAALVIGLVALLTTGVLG